MTEAVNLELPVEDRTDSTRSLYWQAPAASGRTMVLLHGLGDGADVWRPVMDAWPGDRFSALAIDFPGHGGADFLDATQYTVSNLAKWLGDLLTDRGIHAPILVGHSMGGRVALEAALQGYIEPLHTVVIDVSPDPKDSDDLDDAIKRHLEMLATGASNINSFRQKIGASLPMSDRAVLKQIVPALVAAGAESGDTGARLRLDPEIHRLLNAPHEVNGWAALEALGCPGTIIRGAFSSALDSKTAEKMARTLRQSTGYFTIPKAGHAIAFEQPVALAQAIAQGLKGVR